MHVQKGSESRIILDEMGAEDLLGKGDMLLKTVGEPVKRAHGFALEVEEIKACIEAG